MEILLREATQAINALSEHKVYNIDMLSNLVGGNFTNDAFGKGKVESVDITDLGVLLDVCFENGKSCKYRINAFKNGHLSNLFLPEEALLKIIDYIKPLDENRARQEKEEKIRREQEEKIRLEHEEKAQLLKEEKARKEQEEKTSFAKQYLIRHEIKSLWYISHINNLDSIVEKGLYCRNIVEAKDLSANDISNEQVQLRRRSYHNYVNLYFADNTPMLYVVIKQFQDSIVLLEIDPFETMLAGVRITDGNAASNDTVEYDDLSGLQELDWSIIRERRGVYDPEEKRKRSAEFLIIKHVDSSCIRCVHVQSPQVVEYAKNTLSRLNRTNITVKKDLTINGIV